jgi:dTDP-4-dehydrorhamnose 3,5-epimerase
MILTEISIAGAYLVDLEPRADSRGSFSRAFCLREFAAKKIAFPIAQCNLARTTQAGVVRGLHYQEKPAEEQKLVRCVVGAVFDTLVDMRPDSLTYKTVYSVRLDTDNRKALFVPGGVAHGYQTLTDHTEFLYMTDQFYAPGAEKGVRFSDPSLAIAWPLAPHDVAERDKAWPLVNWGK